MFFESKKSVVKGQMNPLSGTCRPTVWFDFFLLSGSW